MRIVLTFFLLSNLLFALDKPTIALVLGGGGARGGAHVGVLKVLEEKKIPIDFIVGTSIGAFVGGLYASGKSPWYIEKMLTTTDWTKYIRTDFQRENTSMRRKSEEYQYQGKLGLGINEKNKIVLPTGVLDRQPMLLKYLEETKHVENITNFDDLTIPFRSVATNIKNGNKVVLSSGSLAKAIYASTAIPGGFQPINIDGIDLVDGGVSDNIPISVAKEMGADIIIAVDVSEQFNDNLDVNSYLTVVGQLMNILMRKNANDSIAKLTKQDILITPNLEGYGGLDIESYAQIIDAGEQITHKIYEKELKHLSISDEKYALYKKTQKFKLKNEKIVIDKILVENPTYMNNQVILSKIRQKTGQILDEDKLREDVLAIYDLGFFDNIDYEIIEKNDTKVLKLVTTPSWNTHGEINISFGFEDDFDGHSSYSLKAGYTKFGLNSYGGEWKNDIEIGRNKKLYTEYFQPLTSDQRYYFKSVLLYNDRTENIPAKSAGLLQNGNFEMKIKRYGIGLGFGTHISNNYELEIGYANYRDNLEVELASLKANYDAKQIYGSLKIDNLDNVNFPKTGIKSQIKWTKELDEFGSDYDFEQIYIDIEKPITFGKHNITTYLKYGSTYSKTGVTSLAGSFTLGGLFNLSGFVPYSLNDDNMFLGVLKYRYKLKGGGLFGNFNASLYAGFSAEIGNTWDYNDNINFNKMHKSGTVYLASDTLLGPFYLAYGHSDNSDSTVYLYLGEKF